MSNDSPQITTTGPPEVSELIADIVAGKVSTFDLPTSAPEGDYRAHVEMMRTFGAISSDLGALKAFLTELQQEIADHEVDRGDSEEIEKQFFGRTVTGALKN